MQGFFLSDVDHRAWIRVRAAGAVKTLDLLLEIDTGASNEVFISHELATELGLQILASARVATLADGSELPVLQAKLQIEWLDGTREVDATVWPSNPNKRGRRKRSQSDGLIGQALLLQSHLSIDYVNRKVVLTKPVIEGA
jgi:predicted aspartyl protease